ncbi:TfuA-like protein [Candidatus Entotheonella palauensis]|uniref:TfuA-like core domain-containing protein n=1 Tax=Candidatus Entotheonella gemina TaxID=1429439 RepID=W4MA43_9BACT|nr:TfuA-like protein [Candidatus Entotheonella palauensis]ETX06766.1 MAG: hypothetical protein ETSY2_15125 [Candidatus Entotheonella gemina]
MNKIYIFAGPSLGANHRYDLPAPCILQPPAVRGSIQHLLSKPEGPGCIAVIDGYFGHELAVSHEELCAALDHGWHIWGLSGIGAIRAYELRHEGMQGYGRVYNYFHHRADFRDDEVAYVHDLAPPYQAHSEPMVHLREAVKWLVRSEGFATSEGSKVIKALERMWFGERSMDCFLALLRHGQPPVSDNTIRAMLNNFSQFRIKLRDVEQFFSEQPWQCHL